MKKIDLKNRKNLIIAVALVVLVLIILAFFIHSIFFKTEKKVVVKHNTVDELYKAVKNTSCTYVGNINESKLSDNTILYVVFSKLNNEDELDDEISIKDFKNAAKNVIKDGKAIPEEFSNYEYDWYSYSSDGKKITRTKGTCGDKEYISKLYGYTYNNNELIVNIKVAYKKEGKLYNLNDEVFADYDKENENILMDSATSQIYTYSKDGDKYYLKSIINEKKESDK